MAHQLSDDELFAYAERAKGKVVVITGGANGIGKETALVFSKHGAKVVIGDLDTAGAEAVVAEIVKTGGKAASIKCNVLQWEDLVALFDLAIERYGVVDIVIPNAGINETGDVCRGELTIVDGKPIAPKLMTLRINLIGVFYTVHLGVHYIKRNRTPDSWKAIVLIGSMASWQAVTKAPQYSASKHGVLGVMRSLEPTLSAENIRIGVVHPWFADTKILSLPISLILAGIPLTPVARVAGAIFRAATDPNPETNGCPWVLPDDGPVLLLEKEALRTGVYEMMSQRVQRIKSFVATVQDWVRLFRDLARIFRPVLVFGIPALILALAQRRRLIKLPSRV
ncbi:hypothetical protein BC834DRAFT_967214 [Gloeopeniophorella convolvens]|nr:hypothetical protein BC834DRAFT_967214 [Gloeopeniophorella convolvens]